MSVYKCVRTPAWPPERDRPASRTDAAAREAPWRGSGSGVQSRQRAPMATTSQGLVTIHQDELELAPPAVGHDLRGSAQQAGRCYWGSVDAGGVLQCLAVT